MNAAAPRRTLLSRLTDLPAEVRVAALYTLIAGLWIYWSDTVLMMLARTPERFGKLSIYKGWFFVAFTAVLLYFELRRIFARIRRGQQQLREKERTMSIILDSISELFLYQTPDHRILWTNRAAAESLGLRPEDLPKRFCYAFWQMGGRECESCPVRCAIQTGETYEREIRAPGDRSWHIRGYPIKDGEGKVEAVVEVVLDITDRKRAEDALRALNETLEQRVAERTAQLRGLALQLSQAEQKERRRIAHILHEHFQQLLVAAKFHVDMVRRHPERPAEPALRGIDQTVDEAIRIARSLTVELSPPVLYDVGLVQALDWLSRWMRERHGLQVTVVADPAAEPCEEDLRVMLFHAVRELLFNVVKHAGASAARLEMSRRDRKIEIVVTDTGNGFDPAHRPQQRDLASGYGLFTIRERLQSLGGCVQIDSTPGQGTCVRLSVPVGECDRKD